MDRNSLLAVALSMLVFTMWAMYQAQQSAERANNATEIVGTETTPESVDENIAADSRADESIAPDSAGELTPIEPPKAAERPAEPAETASDRLPRWTRTFERPGFDATLSNEGAALVGVTLNEFVDRQARGEVPVRLVGDRDGEVPALATPLRKLGLGDLSRARFQVLAEDEDGVDFVWQRDGVRVDKRYRFPAEGYGFTLTVRVENGTDRVLMPGFDLLWPARAREIGEFSEPGFAVMNEGSVDRDPISAYGFFGRSGVEELVEYEREIDWAALEDKYFLRAVLPDRPRSARASYEPLEVTRTGVMSLGFEPVQIPAGQSVEHEFQIYVGPKRSADLQQVSPSLGLAVNRGYSVIEPLTRFFEWLLHAIYQVVPNYGFAIILLTILVRLVTAPIMQKQMKSMERMRAVQPMLKEIQEKYKDDRQKQSEEMMAMYRREGVNPLGGCLPMLLQFPVFIGLFFALQSSFDLRHANFMLWIDDLSAPESLFTIPGVELPVRVLPIIMGASMVLQQKLTPTTVDPAQARMMMTIMPIMFTVLFYQFPSGLVLYWMVSNLLGIAHQLWVGRKLRQQ